MRREGTDGLCGGINICGAKCLSSEITLPILNRCLDKLAIAQEDYDVTLSSKGYRQ